MATLLFGENLGAPAVPGETMLVAGAIYAAAGRLNIVAVALIAVAASVAGGCGGWAIGRFGGRALVLRYGRYVLLTARRLDRAERFFTSRGAFVITFARFLEGLRQANGIIAGITGMPLLRFLVFNSLGAVLWVAVWASLGDLAGAHISAIYQDVTRYLLYVLAGLAVAIAALIGWYLLHRRRHRTSADPAPSTGSSGAAGQASAPGPTAPAGPADHAGAWEATGNAEHTEASDSTGSRGTRGSAEAAEQADQGHDPTAPC